MRSIFRFKQFEVDQGNCAMKINTDGVLLGSSTYFPEATRILDIGTGTGVIALMLAQSHPGAQVDAVEIDHEAYLQAESNFRKSVFANRLKAFHGSFADLKPEAAYDLIVSNPPFYTNALKNPDARKRLAKHTDRFFFEVLLSFVARYLTDRGRFSMIVPTALADSDIVSMLPRYDLHVQSEMLISSFSEQEAHRKILQIGKDKLAVEKQELTIYEEKTVYSEAYKALLEPYFLAY